MSSVEDGSNRPLKRQREDAPDNVLPSSNFTASKDIWFEDGSIILVCESIGFRVYKGILSSQSEVFRDMLSVGSPSEDETIDGCAVVHLSDSACDALHFLKTLHDWSYGRCSVEDRVDVPRYDLPFSTITGILRMATKYMAHGLRRAMVDEIKGILPSTLHQFKSSSDGRCLIPDFNGILAVNIATECRIPIILPAAYYYCSMLSTQTLLEGLQLESGVVVKLSSQALPIALAFRRKITTEIVRAMDISRFWASRHWRCMVDECAIDPVIVALDVETLYLNWNDDGIFPSGVISDGFSMNLCQSCYDLLMARELTLQQTIWGLLPKLCEEESWAALVEKQEQIDEDENALLQGISH